jgi:hypothetical protein
MRGRTRSDLLHEADEEEGEIGRAQKIYYWDFLLIRE